MSLKQYFKKSYAYIFFLFLGILLLPVQGRAVTKGTTAETAFEDKEEAADYLCTKMLNHNTFIQFYYKDDQLAEDLKNQSVDKITTFMNTVYELACQYNPSNPEAGDYLRFNAQRWQPINGTKWVSDGIISVEYKVSYNGGNLGNEQQVNEEVSRIIASLSLDGLTDRKKIETIYRYVCKNVSFAPETADELKNYINYSAYAALFNKKAYCQGYSSLLFRLLMEAGFQCRIISNVEYESINSSDGLPDPDSHSWNIVKCDGVWYPLDATWDRYEVSKGSLKYFMPCSQSKNNDTFSNHVRALRFRTSDFYASYPMGVHKTLSTITAGYLLKKCTVCGQVLSKVRISPNGTTISKLKAYSKKIKISWKKQASLSNGYQIQYSLKSNFTNAKNVVISKNTTTSKTITKLKKKKTYYLRIRTYRIYGGKKYYSPWSGKKKIKTK